MVFPLSSSLDQHWVFLLHHSDVVGWELLSSISSHFPSSTCRFHGLLPFPSPGWKPFLHFSSWQVASPISPTTSLLGLCLLPGRALPLPHMHSGSSSSEGRSGTARKGDGYVCRVGEREWGLEQRKRREKLGRVITLQRHDGQIPAKSLCFRCAWLNLIYLFFYSCAKRLKPTETKA